MNRSLYVRNNTVTEDICYIFAYPGRLATHFDAERMFFSLILKSTMTSAHLQSTYVRGFCPFVSSLLQLDLLSCIAYTTLRVFISILGGSFIDPHVARHLFNDSLLVAHPALVKDERNLLDCQSLDLWEGKVDDDEPD